MFNYELLKKALKTGYKRIKDEHKNETGDFLEANGSLSLVDYAAPEDLTKAGWPEDKELTEAEEAMLDDAIDEVLYRRKASEVKKLIKADKTAIIDDVNKEGFSQAKTLQELWKATERSYYGAKEEDETDSFQYKIEFAGKTYAFDGNFGPLIQFIEAYTKLRGFEVNEKDYTIK